MWRVVLLRIIYVLFFVVIFLVALLIFLRLINAQFLGPWIQGFVDSLVNAIKL